MAISFYFKNGSTWQAATKVYKKINGSWVEQSSSSFSNLVDRSIVPYLEFPFSNESLTENQMILSEYKKIVKGN